jgi:hypothetical protein
MIRSQDMSTLVLAVTMPWGGTTEQRPIWIDLVFRAMLSLDGNTILEDGNLKI